MVVNKTSISQFGEKARQFVSERRWSVKWENKHIFLLEFRGVKAWQRLETSMLSIKCHMRLQRVSTEVRDSISAI